MNLILIALVSIINSLFLIISFLLGLEFGINNARVLKKHARKNIFSNLISDENDEDEFDDDKKSQFKKVSKIMNNIDNYSGDGEGQENIDDF